VADSSQPSSARKGAAEGLSGMFQSIGALSPFDKKSINAPFALYFTLH
jgi:hypothetical protein